MSGPFKDAIEGIHPKSRSSSGWFFIILVLFIIGGFYYTIDARNVFTDHQASEDFNSLVYAFQSLSYGDMSGFIEGLLGSLTLIGLFMVMFALMHFLFITALKPLFPKKKYAMVLSLVMTTYAFVNPRIYNYLINLNAFVVGFVVFLALVIMLWGFGDKAGRDMLHSFDDLANLKRNPHLINDKAYVRRLKEEIERDRRRQR
ncbi:MAG: hypothetical protein KC535_04270 [Nanoarchaeota archaeon]|nr:hypothetical protein [Nanoarchaeota archaeon]